MSALFFFNDTATTEIYTLSLHDALPISEGDRRGRAGPGHRVEALRPSRRRASGLRGPAEHLGIDFGWSHGVRDGREEVRKAAYSGLPRYITSATGRTGEAVPPRILSGRHTKRNSLPASLSRLHSCWTMQIPFFSQISWVGHHHWCGSSMPMRSVAKIVMSRSTSHCAGSVGTKGRSVITPGFCQSLSTPVQQMVAVPLPIF